jgi:hypothetical protein
MKGTFFRSMCGGTAIIHRSHVGPNLKRWGKMFYCTLETNLLSVQCDKAICIVVVLLDTVFVMFLYLQHLTSGNCPEKL